MFDKGLTYAQVAKACRDMFGLKVSRSSVGRYFERTMQSRFYQQLREERLKQFAKERAEFAAMSGGEKYRALFERLAEVAVDMLNRVEPRNRRQVKAICALVKVLIAARLDESMKVRAEVERARFEIWAARQCLEHLRSREWRLTWLRTPGLGGYDKLRSIQFAARNQCSAGGSVL